MKYSMFPRWMIPVIAVTLVLLVGSYPVAQAIAPLVAVGIGLVVGGTIGGLIGYWLGQSQKNAELVHEQYQDDVDKYTKNLMTVYSNSWYNIVLQMKDVHDQFFNNTFNYYQRWAESIASSVCNENKTTITDDDLDPIIKDYTTIIKNYMTRILDSLYDLYTKAKYLSGMRKNAGLDDTVPITSDYGVESDGTVVWLYGSTSSAGPLKEFDIIINDQVVGYISSNGSKFINETLIKELFLSESSYTVKIEIITENGYIGDFTYYVKYDESSDSFISIDDLSPSDFLSRVLVDVKMMYTNVKASAQNYCYMISVSGGEELPPPSIALPYDYETLNKMDPQSRMILYQTYLYYLSETDWGKVQELTADSIKGLPDKTIKVSGSVDVDGDGVADYTGTFIPMNIPHKYEFSENEESPIAGLWYYWDGERMRLIKIEPKPVPDEYTVVESIGDGIVKVEYTDPDTNTTKYGILVDVDNDGEYDYLEPLINVTGIKDVKYDYETGEYKEEDVDSVDVGPKPADEWTTMKLEEAGALSEIDVWKFKLSDWWNGLDWKMKALVIAGGAIFLILILRAVGGSRIVIAR